MKRSLLCLLFLLLCPGVERLAAQDEEVNILSYYAVGNSLDGQPMIERPNALRFYPVYALREYTDTVKVTIYYGSHIYTRNADPYDDRRYWQVLLPKFVLGEAIQRIEVETSINLKEHPLLGDYQRIIDALKSGFDSIRRIGPELLPALVASSDAKIQASLKEIDQSLIALPDEVAKKLQPYLAAMGEGSIASLTCSVQQLYARLGQPACCADSILRADLPDIITGLKEINEKDNAFLGSLQEKLPMLVQRDSKAYAEWLAEVTMQIDPIKKKIDTIRGAYKTNLTNGLNDFLKEVVTKGDSLMLRLTHIRDSLRALIAAESVELLTDTTFAGPGVRKADVVFDEKSLTRARILYRNYKTTLRNLAALDPAERMGIFRLRYVPFVVRGRNYTTPFTSTSTAVFEVGLGFSNVAISGDDFVIPDLSLRRLGLAFAVTSKLFGDEAQIRALAVTYDFNAYGSIGIGTNFPGKKSSTSSVPDYESYLSFGINKLAFEQLLVGLAALLNRE